MLNNKYFYNETTKKVIAVFGSIFNDITIARLDAEGNKQSQRVPIKYAPTERYLTLIDGEDEVSRPAITLPTMSFEISNIGADIERKLNRLNLSYQTLGEDVYKVWQSAAYYLDISLKVMTRGHDEALQIVEQIFPFFNPTYTITVKGMEGPDSKTDLPITLTGSDLEDSYAGNFESSRRLIIYTLNFQIPIKYILPIKDANGGVIKEVRTEFTNCDGDFLTGIQVRTKYQDETEDDYTCIIDLDAPQYIEGDPIWDERP